jgi:hypothetical protein
MDKLEPLWPPPAPMEQAIGRAIRYPPHPHGADVYVYTNTICYKQNIGAVIVEKVEARGLADVPLVYFPELSENIDKRIKEVYDGEVVYRGKHKADQPPK